MRGRDSLPREAGAAAVEFALVSVLLFTILFGIMQYGILLWQVQAGTATVQELARQTARGLSTPCTPAAVLGSADTIGQGNGLPAGAVTALTIAYSPTVPTADAARDKTATITLTVQPTDFGLPFVPMPTSLSPTAATLVETAGTCVSPITAP